MAGRQLGIVLIVLIALGVAGLVFRLVSVEGELVTLSDVSPLNEETVDRVVIRNNEFETIVEKEDGVWKVGPYPVVRRRFDDMWDTTKEFNGAELIATNPDNHLEMGVSAENGTLAQFFLDDELVEEFLIGDQQFAPVGEKIITPWTAFVRTCYVRYPDQNEVYGVYCDFPDRFLPDSRFWKNPIITEIPRDEIESISFNYTDEQFDVRVINSVWTLTSGSTEEQVDPQLILALLQKIELLVTIDFPSDSQMKRLDFSIADITMAITVRDGALSRSALLLFLKREDEEGGYWVKEASEPFAYFLDDAEAGTVLKKIVDFVPLEQEEPAPTPAPAPSSP